MTSSYYDRTNVVHLDGTQIFQKPEDQKAERGVAAEVEARWGCKMQHLGALSPVDWIAARHGRTVGVLELKTRHHHSSVYPNVFLNVRKWLALTLAAVGMGVPAIYVVKFDDQLCWAPLTEVDATKHIIGGCSRIVKSGNDIEPIVMVPLTQFRIITQQEELL